ncbi:MAG: UDP-N-acetylmuramate--L-alanine ligase [Anaerolineae bacterium]
MLRLGMHLHLVGIGGIGLSAIARVLHDLGYQVSGCDRQPSPVTEALTGEGVPVSIGHDPTHLIGVDMLVVSAAVPGDIPEVVEARRQGVPVVKREQLLGDLAGHYVTLAIAGTHGKTTTSAMVAWILTETGQDPTFIVGGILQNLGTNARVGRGRFLVVEADEYDRTFLGLRPEIAVVTTLEYDHPDCYPTFEAMRHAFQAFTDRLAPTGRLIVCGQDEEARQLGERLRAKGSRVETYGFGPAWDWWAQSNLGNGGASPGSRTAFEVWHRNRFLGTCVLPLPGRHNVLNALAALAVSHHVGVDFEPAATALGRFRGTQRRLEIKGEAAAITVVDDYAHHPTEIRATLEAMRMKYPNRKLWAVFQPHTYSRTAALINDFAAAFDQANHVLVTDIYAAREQNTLGISGADLVARMSHPDARYIPFDEAATILLEETKSGDVIITLGAGDGYRIGEQVLAALRQKGSQKPRDQETL